MRCNRLLLVSSQWIDKRIKNWQQNMCMWIILLVQYLYKQQTGVCLFVSLLNYKQVYLNIFICIHVHTCVLIDGDIQANRHIIYLYNSKYIYTYK